VVVRDTRRNSQGGSRRRKIKKNSTQGKPAPRLYSAETTLETSFIRREGGNLGKSPADTPTKGIPQENDKGCALTIYRRKKGSIPSLKKWLSYVDGGSINAMEELGGRGEIESNEKTSPKREGKGTATVLRLEEDWGKSKPKRTREKGGTLFGEENDNEDE